jgi:hypothetical protein
MTTDQTTTDRTPRRRVRVYPTCCTSAFCGRVNCEGCRHKADLEEFDAWVKATDARCADPIWAPLVYVA